MAATLLGAHPSLTVISTSRAPPGTYGEVLYPLSPLCDDDRGHGLELRDEQRPHSHGSLRPAGADPTESPLIDLLDGTGEIAGITCLRERLRMERPRLTDPAPR
ncbi:hypothetical protein ACH41H_27590 [Streptomyces sp. NPDC020800]|uniref:hypothetical protein n=1 Tax=Streptomyces sp. NPDC020800 TaxID=3365092 RepID=UPI0037B7C909